MPFKGLASLQQQFERMLAARVLQKGGAKGLISENKAPAAGFVGHFVVPTSQHSSYLLYNALWFTFSEMPAF